jgi:hypothetical protein
VFAVGAKIAKFSGMNLMNSNPSLSFDEKTHESIAQIYAIEDLLKAGFSKKLVSAATDFPVWELDLLEEELFGYQEN